jgi:hypothetical protein
MNYIARMPQQRRAGRRKVPPPSTDIPFGRCIARRQYFWQPPVGGRRQVVLEIGTPVMVGREEWACRFRITGLPKDIRTAAHGSDAVQALELALVGAGALLSRSPQFRAGQIEMWNRPVKNAAELFLPLPLNSIQGALQNLRGYLERQQQKERKTERDWFDPEWRRALLSMMREISGDLATLAAHLPIAPAAGARKRRTKAGRGGRARPVRPARVPS